MKNNFVFILLALAVFAVGGFLIYKNGPVFLGAELGQKNESKEINPEKLAECLQIKNVKIYGADWCPACQAQKEVLGDAWGHIDYINCSQNGSNVLSPMCRSEHIRTLPTWIFPGNLRKEGEFSIKEIAELSGCSGG